MKFDNKYYEDGVIEGFFVPGMIKRAWASQLEILEKIKEICDKYQINWYADFGTLLGAVRHAGFIPWDDDLDICMLREDLERFLEVAPKELPEKYSILNVKNTLEYEDFLTRIVCNTVIDDGNEYLMEHHGFPYIAGIDIFALDYVYKDRKKEEERLRRIGVVVKKLEECNDFSIASELRNEIEFIFSECPAEESEEVALMPYWYKSRKNLYQLKWFSEHIEMPFETTTIPVPAAYEEVLKVLYGRWEIANRKGGIHQYPFYTEQEILYRETKNHVLYQFEPDLADYNYENRKAHLRATDINEEFFSILEELNKLLSRTAANNNLDELLPLLDKGQELAVNLGNNIEKEYGNGTKTVEFLEAYCEHVFRLYEMLQNGMEETDSIIEALNSDIQQSRTFYRNNLKTKQIYFLPVRFSDWDKMEPVYNYYKANPQNKVYVMPIPYADRKHDGSVNEWHWEYNLFPQDLPLVNCQEVDLRNLHPQSYVIHNPWDEYGSGLTVDFFFYANNLRAYTEELVYVPLLDIDEFGEQEEKAMLNLKHYVISPGTFYSDTIILQSEVMKERYIDCISPILQGERKDNWVRKIHVMDLNNHQEKQNETSSKKLVYYIGFNDFFVMKEKVFKEIEKYLVKFEEAKEEVVWVIDDFLVESINRICPELSVGLEHAFNQFKSNQSGMIIPLSEAVNHLNEYESFYGSGGYLMNLCIHNGIPTKNKLDD